MSSTFNPTSWTRSVRFASPQFSASTPCSKKQREDGTEYEDVTWVNSGIKAEDLLSPFRNSYFPRIAVTVDMIATGTDVRPLEIVFFYANSEEPLPL